MKDFTGNELEIGQKVVCLTTGRRDSGHLMWGKVHGFTPQKVKLEVEKYGSRTEITLRDPANVVVPMNSDITTFLMSSGIVGRHLLTNRQQ